MAATVLIVDDEAPARDVFALMLKDIGYEVVTAENLAQTRQHLAMGIGDVLVLDLSLPDGSGFTLMEQLSREAASPPCVVITGYGDIASAVEAMKLGAIDFLPKPVDFDRLRQAVEKGAERVALRRELDHLRSSARGQAEWVVGETSAMIRIAADARRIAARSAAVLITGETGTGKEVLARAIHEMGPRGKKPFVAINCPAIAPDLVESELFGHEAGAFTNANKRKPGLLETADGGVLFLDEIGAMPYDLQSKLLRVLDSQTFRRVGGVNEIKVDLQIIAATNRPIPDLIAQGKFRDDLYYRLKVVEFHLPPLRERKEDIPALVGLFIRQLNLHHGNNVTGATSRALAAFKANDWCGNVRELRFAVERGMMFCDGGELDLPHLDPMYAQLAPPPPPPANGRGGGNGMGSKPGSPKEKESAKPKGRGRENPARTRT